MEKILEEIRKERVRQDEKWGGPEHDDAHDIEEWIEFIQSYASWAKTNYKMNSPDKFRRRMVQVAALAVAAVESFDRKISDAVSTINSFTQEFK